MASVAHVRSVRAGIPRRRAVRARVGVLEDVHGSTGVALDSEFRDAAAGNGLSSAGHDEDALSVREAELSMERRRGASEK